MLESPVLIIFIRVIMKYIMKLWAIQIPDESVHFSMRYKQNKYQPIGVENNIKLPP